MRRIMTSMLGIFAIVVILMATPPVRAAEAPTGRIDEKEDQISFSSGSLTAVFEGMGPKIRFYDHTSVTRVEQTVQFKALIEFADADGNKVYESNEAVGKAFLDSGKWTHTGFYGLPGGSGIGINFTLVDPIAIHEGTRMLPTGSMVLVVKAYNTTQTLTLDGKTFDVTTAEVKIDVVINSYPFLNSTNMLALQMDMKSSTQQYGMYEDSGVHTVDGTTDEGKTSEHEFKETTDVKQETRFSTGPITASSTFGFFHFVNRAMVTPLTGASYSVPVTASYKSETETEGSEKAVEMKLYLAYPNFGTGTLVHDPSVGLGQGFPTLYLIAGGAAVAGLAAVVIIRRRHPRINVDSVAN